MVGKQWHALCNSHCVSNPRRPPRSNPLFPLFVRSRLPPPIGCVSSGPREQQEEPTNIVVPLARARAETKKNRQYRESEINALIAQGMQTVWENVCCAEKCGLLMPIKSWDPIVRHGSGQHRFAGRSLTSAADISLAAPWKIHVGD